MSSTPTPPGEAEVLTYFQSLSNWGRWGPDDQLGTLNYITADKRRAAAALVTDGQSVGCARPVVVEAAIDAFPPPMHYMVRVADPLKQESGAADFVGMAPHGRTITHVDALSHRFWDGQMYNGRPASMVTAIGKASACSIEVMRDGVVTRGVLLDIARLRGRDFLDPGDAIYPDELDAAAKLAGIEVTPGDALLIRTGWSQRRMQLGPPEGLPRPGLQAACLPWLHAHGVALVAADVSHDVSPSGYTRVQTPIHTVGIVAMGLCLIDACQFEDLARACAGLNRWEFLFSLAPIRFRNATASPVTPLAIL